MLTSLLDGYELKARTLPSILILSPMFTLFTSDALFDIDLGTLTLGVLILMALFAFWSSIVRNQGKKHESRLIKIWGGLPTTILLRHRDNTLNTHTKSRYHNTLQKIGLNITLPSEADETNNPEHSDSVYSSIIDQLREITRDKDTFPLVYKELVNYGFARNLRGIRFMGEVIGLIVLLSDIALSSGKIPSDIEHLFYTAAPQSAWHIGAVVGVCQILALAILVNDRFVRKAGDNYAKALLTALDRI